MTRQITCTSTLHFYDGIQVFEGRDRIGGCYVGTLVDEDPKGQPVYAVVGVPPTVLQRFRMGLVDLRSLMKSVRAEEGWHLGPMVPDRKTGALIVRGEPRDGDVPEEYLPEEGFVVSVAPDLDASTVRRESALRNTIAVELAVESLAPSESHRLRADSMGGLLIHVQSVVKNGYRKAAARAGVIGKKVSEWGIAPLFDVAVPAATGSLKMVLVPAQSPDLFGGGDLEHGLDVLDHLLANVEDAELTMGRVQEFSGHTAGAFVRLLQFMVETNLTIRYSWAAPDRAEVTVRTLRRSDAVPLLSRLRQTADLTVEPVELRGLLRKVDVDSGTWRLLSLSDDTEHSGRCREGTTLTGLIIDRPYIFVCEEESAEVAGTGREVRTLYLVAHSELPDQ